MQNYADISHADSRIGLKEILAPSVGTGGNWYLNEDCSIYGPLSWIQIKEKARQGQITPLAQIKEDLVP